MSLYVGGRAQAGKSKGQTAGGILKGERAKSARRKTEKSVGDKTTSSRWRCSGGGDRKVERKLKDVLRLASLPGY